MTERKSLSERPARGALAEGAERFDLIARTGRNPKTVERQPGEGDGPRMIGVAPDEVWARNYMTYGISAKAESPVVAGFAPVAHLVTMPKFVAPTEPVVQRTAEITAMSPSSGVVPSGPIGARIGKPIRRRSWFGRLFLGPA